MSTTWQIVLYILVMAGVTSLIRSAPLVLFRKKIQSDFFRNMLYYLPYAVLSAMVIPAVFSSTGSFVTALAGLIVACLLSFFNRSLIIVALGACATAFITGEILTRF